MQRLDDAEFGRRQRERNLRANRQRRERMTEAGFIQWNLWINNEVRALAERLADDRNQSPSDLVTALIQSAALTPTIPEPSQQSRAGATFQTSIPEPTTPVMTTAERDQQILELKRSGLSSREIAKHVSCGKTTVLGVLKRMETHQ